MEDWRPIVGFEGFYEVSSHGRVRSLARTRRGRYGVPTLVRERILRQYVAPGGYAYVALSREDRQRKYWVHRLVASAFLGCVDGKVVNHLNADPSDNTVSNLEITTQSGNIRHAVKLRGGRHWVRSMVSEAVVADIHSRLRSGQSVKSIARSVGVSATHTHRIIDGSVKSLRIQ